MIHGRLLAFLQGQLPVVTCSPASAFSALLSQLLSLQLYAGSLPASLNFLWPCAPFPLSASAPFLPSPAQEQESNAQLHAN